jgi:hypothetical protein
LVSVAVIDAKSKGGGGGKSSSSYTKSVSSKTTSSLTEGAAKAVGISIAGIATTNTKKKLHLDDDFFENETEDETTEQSPGVGVLPAFLAMGILLLARRKKAV